MCAKVSGFTESYERAALSIPLIVQGGHCLRCQRYHQPLPSQHLQYHASEDGVFLGYYPVDLYPIVVETTKREKKKYCIG